MINLSEYRVDQIARSLAEARGTTGRLEEEVTMRLGDDVVKATLLDQYKYEVKTFALIYREIREIELNYGINAI